MAKTKVHGEYLDPSVISGQTQVTAVGADSVLILDATDNALKKALLSDVIETVGSTPSFTSATISGDLTVDTSTLKVDSSNNRVGVGTASPAFTLDVQDTSDPAQIRLKEDGNTNGFIFKNFNGNEAQLVNVDDGPMVFKTNDTERTRIGNTGKASWSAGGIGAVSTQDRDFTFYTEGSTNGIDIRSNDYRNILLGAGGSSGAAMDAGYIGIYKDGSTKIALNANGVSYFDGGNVGISESSPNNAALHINQTVAAVANNTSDFSAGTNLALWIENSASSGYPRIFNKSNSSSVAVVTNYEDGKHAYWGEPGDNRTYYFRGTGSSSVNISGSLTKGSGSFKIDHPLESKKDTHDLVHSFVESPQANNIYRGVAVLENGTATINLDTASGMSEGTYILLNTNTSCFTSNESDWDAVKGSVSGNILTISCQNTSSTAKVSWMVIGERQDQHIIDANWTDENGKVIVEPLKDVNA